MYSLAFAQNTHSLDGLKDLMENGHAHADHENMSMGMDDDDMNEIPPKQNSNGGKIS